MVTWDRIASCASVALHPYPDRLQLVSKVGAEHAGGGLVAAQRPEQLRAVVEADLASLGVERLAVVNLRRVDTGPGIVATGDQVVDLDWWQAHTVDSAAGPVEIVFTPSQHWSGRSLGDRMETLWGGYAVFAPDFHFFFAGDTAYSKDFQDIRARFAARQTEALGGGFDIALIPVGAYEPRWFMRSQHVDPAEAVQIHQDLNAKRSVGIHWGTFQLTDEALDQPPIDLAAARQAQGVADDGFFVMAVGETRRLPRRTGGP